MSEKIDYSKGVYDAKKLGTGRMFILGVQHMFAMFGATVLVPLLTGLSVSTTLLCAGLGTLLFHLITKKKVPAFLGSSFAYLGGFSIVAPMLADADGNLTVANTKMLPYACAAIAFSGLVYLVASLLISTFGIRRIMKFFPPVVTGPIIISIGLILAPSAITNCQSNWLLAFVALGTVIMCNIWGKGMVKILPILIGVLVSYAVALVTGAVDFQRISEAAWVGIPLHKEAMGLFAIDGSPEFISALFTIIPIALATIMAKPSGRNKSPIISRKSARYGKFTGWLSGFYRYGGLQRGNGVYPKAIPCSIPSTADVCKQNKEYGRSKPSVFPWDRWKLP